MNEKVFAVWKTWRSYDDTFEDGIFENTVYRTRELVEKALKAEYERLKAKYPDSVFDDRTDFASVKNYGSVITLEIKEYDFAG